MRSEMKIGVGVGAVLLVIIIGYFAVHTSDKKGEHLDTNSSTATGSNSTTGGNTATTGTETAAPPERTPVAQTNLAAENKPTESTSSVSTPPAAGTGATPAPTGSASV